MLFFRGPMASTPKISRLVTKRDLERIDQLEAELARLTAFAERLHGETTDTDPPLRLVRDPPLKLVPDDDWSRAVD
jgi:hypothetical protein